MPRLFIDVQTANLPSGWFWRLQPVTANKADELKWWTGPFLTESHAMDNARETITIMWQRFASLPHHGHESQWIRQGDGTWVFNYPRPDVEIRAECWFTEDDGRSMVLDPLRQQR